MTSALPLKLLLPFLLCCLLQQTCSFTMSCQSTRRGFALSRQLGAIDSTEENESATTEKVSIPTSVLLKTSEVVEAAISAAMNKPRVVKDRMISLLREKGQSFLTTASRPTNKDEAWRFTDIKKLFESYTLAYTPATESKAIASLIEEYIDSACEKSCLIFVDGKYSPALSRINGIDSAALEYSHFCEGQDSGFDRGLPTGSLPGFLGDMEIVAAVPDTNAIPRDSLGSDMLSALNMATCEELNVIHVKGVVNSPVQVLNLLSDSFSGPTSPRFLVYMNPGAELTLKQSYVGGGHASVVNGNFRAYIEEGAKLSHTYIQEFSNGVRHTDVLSSVVKESAKYDLNILTMGGSLSRVNVHIDLLHPGAITSLNCVALSAKDQSLDLHSSILHDTESAVSRQQQRNIVGDDGEVIFKGRIKVPKHAQLTDSDQLCRTLMLGANARLIAMPVLEITADNVVCSHGASVTDLDENSMFYLSARGINRREARKLLLRGFAFEPMTSATMDEKTTLRIVKKLEDMNPALDARQLGADANQAMTSM